MAKVPIPRADAEKAAAEIMEILGPVCKKWIIAGSIRRKKPMVSDVEILYIPEIANVIPEGEMFKTKMSSIEAAIEYLKMGGLLKLRPNKNDDTCDGEKTKLMIHVPTGVAVDFFATTEKRWWNSLVAKTGGLDSNMRISNAALKKGYSWATSTAGFQNLADNSIVAVHSEEEVFDFVRLPYLQPTDRP